MQDERERLTPVADYFSVLVTKDKKTGVERTTLLLWQISKSPTNKHTFNIETVQKVLNALRADTYDEIALVYVVDKRVHDVANEPGATSPSRRPSPPHSRGTNPRRPSPRRPHPRKTSPSRPSPRSPGPSDSVRPRAS